jgi:hypothetical protein
MNAIPIRVQRRSFVVLETRDVVALQQSCSGKCPHKPVELFARGPAQRVVEDLPGLNQREADYDISYHFEFGV